MVTRTRTAPTATSSARPRAWARAVVNIGAALAGTLLLVAAVGASTAEARMRLSAANGARGYVRLVVRDAPGTTVELVERLHGRDRSLLTTPVAAGGMTVVPRAASWRCDRQVRHFRVRATGADGKEVLAAAAVRTPSCRRRIGVIIVGRVLRPGTRAVVRLTDTWALGGATVRMCSGVADAPAVCRAVHLQPGPAATRVRVPLDRAGRWTVTVGLPHGGRQRRTFSVAPGGGLHVLVTGDSMTFGIPEALETLLRPEGGTVQPDTHPGTGLTKPQFVDWPAHAFVVGKRDHPDVSFVLLGAAGDRLPLLTRDGQQVVCCDQPWIDAYAVLVHHVMSTLLQHGHALVYWGLLPAPQPTEKDPTRVVEWNAVNQALVQASQTFPDGAVPLDGIYNALTPDGMFHQSLVIDGEEHVVRLDDGIHLAAYGVGIAADVIRQQLLADELVSGSQPPTQR